MGLQGRRGIRNFRGAPAGRLFSYMMCLPTVTAAVACCRCWFLLLVAAARCSWLAFPLLLIVDVGRLGALVHRRGVSGDRLAPFWGRTRELPSGFKASGKLQEHLAGSGSTPRGSHNAVEPGPYVHDTLLACKGEDRLPGCLLASCPARMADSLLAWQFSPRCPCAQADWFACLSACLLHRLLVRSRPLFVACCCVCLV